MRMCILNKIKMEKEKKKLHLQEAQQQNEVDLRV